MLAGASSKVIHVGGITIVVVAIGWRDGGVFALASGGVVGGGRATYNNIGNWGGNRGVVVA